METLLCREFKNYFSEGYLYSKEIERALSELGIEYKVQEELIDVISEENNFKLELESVNIYIKESDKFKIERHEYLSGYIRNMFLQQEMTLTFRQTKIKELFPKEYKKISILTSNLTLKEDNLHFKTTEMKKREEALNILEKDLSADDNFNLIGMLKFTALSLIYNWNVKYFSQYLEESAKLASKIDSLSATLFQKNQKLMEKVE